MEVYIKFYNTLIQSGASGTDADLLIAANEPIDLGLADEMLVSWDTLKFDSKLTDPQLVSVLTARAKMSRQISAISGLIEVAQTEPEKITLHKEQDVLKDALFNLNEGNVNVSHEGVRTQIAALKTKYPDPDFIVLCDILLVLPVQTSSIAIQTVGREVTLLEVTKSRLMTENFTAVETARSGFFDEAGQAETDGNIIDQTIASWNGSGTTPVIYGV